MKISKYLLPILFVLTLFQAMAQTISKAEYFFDTDPGIGNGTAIVISASDPITFTSTIPTAGLSPGYHFLFIRTRTSDFHWSLYEPQEFFIRQSITAAEYFFDSDPGKGLGTLIPVTPTLDQLTFTQSISTSSLSPGFHVLFIRTKNEKGQWSLYEPSPFYIRVFITRAEYFIDTDPGAGNGTPLTVPAPDDLTTFTPSIPVGALPDGTHFLFIRTRDVWSRWSLYEPQSFVIDSALPIELLSFTVSPTKNSLVNLAWTTETEMNNDYFSVERSKDGHEFYEIAKIKAAGNSTNKLSYQVTDEHPFNGMNYYRLKQTDFDGQYSYSVIRAARVLSIGEPEIYPNPVAGKWFVDLSGISGLQEAKLELLDLAGRKCFERICNDGALIEMERSDFPAGLYFLRISLKNEIPIVRKVIFN